MRVLVKKLLNFRDAGYWEPDPLEMEHNLLFIRLCSRKAFG
jgi:hypothetical protein